MKRCFAVLLCGTLAACDAVVEPQVVSLEIEVAMQRLFPGDTTRLTAIAQNASGDYIISEQVLWESSDTTVVRVTRTGQAIALKPGSAVVRLALAGSKAEQTLHVDSGFVYIDAGPDVTCGLRQSYALYCWGAGRQLGYEPGSSHPFPTRVAGNFRFKTFSSGGRHTCALTLEGRAYCWGNGRYGESGTGSPWYNNLIPEPVIGDLVFASITAGFEHTCALTPDGTAYCWGNSWHGQAGTGIFGTVIKPTRVSTDSRFQSISAAGNNTCALAIDGDAYCWGDKGYLGDHTVTKDQSLPRRVPVPKLRELDAANDDPCGITLSDELYCWTSQVDLVSNVGRVKQVTVGSHHVCVIQLSGTVVCYGRGDSGQLGDGRAAHSQTPVEPLGGLRFVHIAAGSSHTCGLTDTSAAYCWGSNHSGHLGIGTKANQRTPARVLLFE